MRKNTRPKKIKRVSLTRCMKTLKINKKLKRKKELKFREDQIKKDLEN